MNPAAERLFGWSSAELLGRKMHDMIHYQHPDGKPFHADECAGLQVLQKELSYRITRTYLSVKTGLSSPSCL